MDNMAQVLPFYQPCLPWGWSNWLPPCQERVHPTKQVSVSRDKASVTNQTERAARRFP